VSNPAPARIVLVTGLSGAGKASILRALEDLGFEAIDNLPVTLIEDMVDRDAKVPARHIAVGVDARTRGFEADAVLAALRRLRETHGRRVELLFAWADEGVLIRRYTETRRRHPLSPHGSVLEGIIAERIAVGPLHAVADLVIDTSDLPLAGLRQAIERRYGADATQDDLPGLSVTLLSFAFPAGLPREADMVLDARFLQNPHYVSGLRSKTGLDPEVGAYVAADPDYGPFFARIVDLLKLLLPRFVQEGKKYATIAVGCTGGKHRSVHIVEQLAAELNGAGWRVTKNHRELSRAGLLATGGKPGGIKPGATGPGVTGPGVTGPGGAMPAGESVGGREPGETLAGGSLAGGQRDGIGCRLVSAAAIQA
jgi:UPF0042 nucleotide-binding protein